VPPTAALGVAAALNHSLPLALSGVDLTPRALTRSALVGARWRGHSVGARSVVEFRGRNPRRLTVGFE